MPGSPHERHPEKDFQILFAFPQHQANLNAHDLDAKPEVLARLIRLSRRPPANDGRRR